MKYWQPLPEFPQKKTKRTLVLALLADNYPFMLAHKETYALRLCDETIIDELNLDDYFIDCKMIWGTDYLCIRQLVKVHQVKVNRRKGLNKIKGKNMHK